MVVSKKRVLITGVEGYIGRHLQKTLSECNVQVLCTPPHKSGFDITDPEDISSLPPADTVVHLAAIVDVIGSFDISSDRACQIMHTNVEGTINMLGYCLKHGKIPLIFASSYTYGIPRYFPIDENHPISAVNPYAVSKLAAEQVCNLIGERSQIPATILRIFNPYGPEQPPFMVVSRMVKSLVETGKISFDDGAPKRDLLYISDLIAAIIATVEHPPTSQRTYNVGYGDSWSISELAKKLKIISGGKVLIEDGKKPRPDDIPDTVADIAKIKSELGWSPQVSIDEGLKLTYAWALAEYGKKN